MRDKIATHHLCEEGMGMKEQGLYRHTATMTVQLTKSQGLFWQALDRGGNMSLK